MGAAMSIWLDFNERYASKKDSRLSNIFVRLFALLITLLFAFTIGYSRVFLGAHSWNQLLFGWQLGLWLALTYFFCYKKPVMHHMKQMHRGIDKILTKFVIWGLVVFVLAFAVETANYLVVVPKIVIDPLWQDNIESKCPHTDISEAFSNKSEV